MAWVIYRFNAYGATSVSVLMGLVSWPHLEWQADLEWVLWAL